MCLFQSIYNLNSTISCATDTKFYWNLTENIFRYNHVGITDMNGTHTVNEGIRRFCHSTFTSKYSQPHSAISVDAYIEVVRFYSRLILNADETDLLD